MVMGTGITITNSTHIVARVVEVVGRRRGSTHPRHRHHHNGLQGQEQERAAAAGVTSKAFCHFIEVMQPTVNALCFTQVSQPDTAAELSSLSQLDPSNG